jgi:hypothetical protein
MAGNRRKDRAVMTAAIAGIVFFLFLLCPGAEARTRTSPESPGGPPPSSPRVFLEWSGADTTVLRGEIPFVDFVFTPESAQVQVAIISAASGGRETFTLAFHGRKEMAGDDNTLTHRAAPGEKPEESRKTIIGLLKIGLMRYVAKTPAARLVSIDFMDHVRPTSVMDKWNFWVFNLSYDQFLLGETQFSNSRSFGSFAANRVTPGLKIRTSVYGNFQRERFDIDNEVIRSSSFGYGFEGLVVKSLDEHWSAGAYLSVFTSTFSNIRLGVSPSPAVEYDVFRYSDSTRRQLRFLYRFNYSHSRYREVTVYDKFSEGLFGQTLSATLELKKPWGNVEASLEGSHYFLRPFKYRVELSGEASFRIWRGLSLEIDGRYAKINDQISLRKGEATVEEILLTLRELETGYNYSFSVGLNFRFGSLNSNVVNPRFGSGSRRFMMRY